MFELKITATSVADLVSQLDQLRSSLPPAYVVKEGPAEVAIEVPLPEPVAEQPKRRGRPPKAKESDADFVASQENAPIVEPVKETSEIEHVEADVSEIGEEVNTSHAAPGEVYTLKGDGYNNDSRRLTYKDGLRFSSVHKDSEHKFTEYAEHAPEVLKEEELPDEPMVPLTEADKALLDDGIPEHMRDDVAPASVEAALEQLVEGVEPYQEGDEVPEGILDRPTSAEAPTETESAPPVEPEPDTSEPVTPASSDGQEASDSGPSASPAGSAPPELLKFGEDIEGCGSWDQAFEVMKAFFQSPFFKGLEESTQNKVRGRTWENMKDLGNFPLPDPITHPQAFRLYLEAETDPEALAGSFVFLKKDKDAQWEGRSEPVRKVIEDAVARRLKEIG